MIVLHKLLPMLSAPLIAIGALALIGMVLKRRWLSMTALALLWKLSLPIVADGHWWHLEHQVMRPLAKLATAASAFVVLRGMTRIMQGERGSVRGWADGSDRFWTDLKLFKAGRSTRRLVCSCTHFPWIYASLGAVTCL